MTDIQKTLSNILAGRANDETIKAITEALKKEKKPIIGLDPSIVGIWINYGLDERITNLDLTEWKIDGLGEIQRANIMIDGIVLPENTKLSIEYKL